MNYTNKAIGLSNASIAKFESLNEATEYYMAQPINHIFKENERKNRLSSIVGEERFTGTKSMDDALRLMREGWDSGAKKLTKSLRLKNLETQPKEVKKAIFDIVGFQASVPRYLQGVPTSMVNKKTVKQKQKVITLIKSSTYNAMTSAQQIMEDSVKFLQIVQAIEAKGVRVNIYCAFHTIVNGRSEQIFTKIKIKSANERLNLAKMAFPLMHPSFLRRIMFRAVETNPDVKNTGWLGGYGMPAEPKDTNKLLEKGEYYIPVFSKVDEIVNQIQNNLNIK